MSISVQAPPSPMGRATLITAICALLIAFLLLYIKWKIPVFREAPPESSMEVEVNWPPDPPADQVVSGDGGGSGQDKLSAQDETGEGSGVGNSDTGGGGKGLVIPSGSEENDMTSDFRGTGTGGEGEAGNQTPGIGVVEGDRTLERWRYSFNDDLKTATIYVSVKVSPEGKGEFVQKLPKSLGSSGAHISAIKRYLTEMVFNKSGITSTVTVKFVFVEK